MTRCVDFSPRDASSALNGVKQKAVQTKVHTTGHRLKSAPRLGNSVGSGYIRARYSFYVSTQSAPKCLKVPMTQPLTQATPAHERRPTVFISYSREDQALAFRLVNDLQAAGLACWIDTQRVNYGDSRWYAGLAEGINHSYAFVPLISRKSLGSEWVLDEICWSLEEGKPIFPLMLEDLTRDPLFFRLRRFLRVNLFQNGYEQALTELTRVLPAPALPQFIAADAQRRIELAYLEGLRAEETLTHIEKYIALSGTAQPQARRVEARAAFELLPMRKHEMRNHQPEPFDNAVGKIRELSQAVLLGEPGGGKTTTLWKLTAELLAEAAADQSRPLPLFVRLGKWDQPAQTLQEFIAAQVGELGAYLGDLLKTGRAALLLDGLNELPTDQRDSKYQQVQKLIATHQSLMAVVSCREQDYTVELEFPRINIKPLDAGRIHEFAAKYLGEAEGETFFWKLAGGDAVRGVCEVWQKAGASFELFFTAPDIPRESPNVYGATTAQHDQVWQEKVRDERSLLKLARNPYMLLMLASVYRRKNELPDNRYELFQEFVEELLDRENERETIPDETRRLLKLKLARVAFEMQTRQPTAHPQKSQQATTVIARDEIASLMENEALLKLAGSANLLQLGTQVRFAHQLLQEYFAAQFMDAEFRAGRLSAADIWKPAQWWQRTNWEEAAVLLAGLYSDDATPIIEWLSDAQPEIAAQCIARSGAHTPETTRAVMREKWLPRLTDVQSEPNALARAAIGRALAQTGLDNRHGVGVRDGLPDIADLVIPAGSFKYGDKGESDNQPQTLKLPAFRISRYPVTMAQFQCFVDDNGYGDDRWWQDLAADEKHRREPGEQAFKFANHPREGVSWYDAIAFCRWLSWRWDGGYDLKKIDEWKARLPTEFEWERAARGTDGRLYPYEGEFDPAKGNVAQSIGETTNAVGIYPHGASPDGVEEMSGNVWEWCLNNYDKKPVVEARKVKLDNDKNRVLRGGSWISNDVDARAVYRSDIRPGLRLNNFGFRVVLFRPPSFLL